MLRKYLDLTQQEFADRIKVKRNTVATYEMGRSEPSDAAISLICKEFNVNEEWLHTGNGEMFIKISRSQEISDFVSRILSQEPDSFQHRFISILSRLNESDWEVLERIALQLSDIHQATVDSEIAQEITPINFYEPLTSDTEIDAEVEDYRRQLLEEREAAERSKALRDAKEA